MIRLYALGQFHLVDQDQQSVAPRSQKARGLLGLLALAPGYSRSRQWLQDKLWSDRGSEQASASLRQALTEIRRALGSNRHILNTSSNTVALDSKNFEVVFETFYDSSLGANEAEIFESLDVCDQEFENWIRNQRLNYSSNILAAAEKSVRQLQRPTVVIDRETCLEGRQSWFYNAFGDEIARSLQEYSDVRIIDGKRLVGDREVGCSQISIVIILNAIYRGNQWNISVRLERIDGDEILWGTRRQISTSMETPIDTEQVHHLVHEIAIKSMNFLTLQAEECTTPSIALGLANRARRRIFRLDKSALAEANMLFHQAYELEPHGQFLSWQSFISKTAKFEHQTDDFLPVPMQFDQLSSEGLRQSPDNAIALAFAAQSHMLDGNVEASFAFSNKSISVNPNNPLGWAFATNVHLYRGEFRKAHETAKLGRSLMVGRSESFFWDFFACMAASATQQYDDAIKHAENALIFSPNFKAPLRYLYALYCQTGRQKSAQQTLNRIRQFEPEFQPSDFLKPDYPVGTLRRLPMIESIQS